MQIILLEQSDGSVRLVVPEYVNEKKTAQLLGKALGSAFKGHPELIGLALNEMVLAIQK